MWKQVLEKVEVLENLFEPYIDEYGIEHDIDKRYDYSQIQKLFTKVEPAQNYIITPTMYRQKMPNAAKKCSIKEIIYIDKILYEDIFASYLHYNLFAELWRREDIPYDAIVLPWYDINIKNSHNTWCMKFWRELSATKNLTIPHYINIIIDEIYEVLEQNENR